MFENKKIIFFGTNNQISYSIVEQLLEQKANLVFVTQSEPATAVIWKDKLDAYLIADYYSTDTIDKLFKEDLKNQSGFDGFVFGGGTGGVRPIKLSNPNFIQNMFDANVFSFMSLMRHIVKRGFLNDGSSIVALSSVSSIKGLKSKTVYSASKAALEGAIRGCAAELSDRKIRVNAIQKGWVTSDMELDFIQDNRSLNDDNDFKKQLLGAIEPEELANLVSFLLSDQVKTLTGTSILLDGGYTL